MPQFQHNAGTYQAPGASLLQVAVANSSNSSNSNSSSSSNSSSGSHVFLFDLDTLALARTQDSGNYSDADMDKALILEETSRVLTRIFSSKTVVKVGWDTNNGDLAMLRAAGMGAFRSCFDRVEAMLDAAKIVSANYEGSAASASSGKGNSKGGNGLLRAVVQPRGGGGRFQLSLSDAANAFLGRPLHKSMQVSDWTIRPLSMEQRHYAANDALVLLAIMDTLLEDYATTTTGTDSAAASLGLHIPPRLGVRDQYLHVTGDTEELPGPLDVPLAANKSALHAWLVTTYVANGAGAGGAAATGKSR
jgi:hypothetical protein